MFRTSYLCLIQTFVGRALVGKSISIDNIRRTSIDPSVYRLEDQTSDRLIGAACYFQYKKKSRFSDRVELTPSKYIDERLTQMCLKERLYDI